MTQVLSDGMSRGSTGDACSLSLKSKDQDNDDSYLELLQNWPVILVPYILLKCTTITRKVPGLIVSSLKYFAH